MRNVIDFNDARVESTMKKVCRRNGMDDMTLKKLNNITADDYMEISLEALKEFTSIVNDTLWKLEYIRRDFAEKDLGAFGYAMTTMAKQILEISNVIDSYKDLETAINILAEYQNECKYLFLETSILFKTLEKLVELEK